MGEIIKNFNEFVNEDYAIDEKAIAPKDWQRMLDLAVANKDGESTAAKITKKDKAINRFVSGLKLLQKTELEYDEKNTRSPFGGWFADFGNKAIELGATYDEIETIFNATKAPQKFLDELVKLKGKKLDYPGLSDISKAVLKAGYDIEYLKHNGYAITRPGKDAMARNGRKWTIGHKTQIDLGDRKVNFTFDDITDEGGGTSKYVVDGSSDGMFSSMIDWKPLGIRDFIKQLSAILAKVNENSSMNEAATALDSYNKAVKAVEKGGGNQENLIQYGLSDVAGHIDAYIAKGNGDGNIYTAKTITLFKRLVDSMAEDEINNNQPNP